MVDRGPRESYFISYFVFWTKYCQKILSTVLHLGICLLLSLVAGNISIRLGV